MNRKALKEQIEETRASLEKLRAMLDSAADERDDFVVFLYRARKAHRYAVDHDTKSGKRIEHQERTSFIEAQKFGFGGSLNAWRHILAMKAELADSDNRPV